MLGLISINDYTPCLEKPVEEAGEGCPTEASVAQNHHELQSTSDKLSLSIITFAIVLCDYQKL